MKAVMSDKLVEILKDKSSREQLREGLRDSRYQVAAFALPQSRKETTSRKIKTRDAAYTVQLINVKG